MSQMESQTNDTSVRNAFLTGARTVIPILLGIIPFGLITGVTAVDAGIPPIQAIAMSAIVFAGASQLAAIDLIGNTAPVAVVVVTAIIINLRHVMYSASIAPYLQRLSGPWKWLCAYGLTDQTYAVSLTEFRVKNYTASTRKWFYLGAAVTLWGTWQLGTIVGVVAGAQIPSGLSLEFAVPLTFIALLFPALEDRPTILAAIVAGAISAIAGVLPFDLGLVVATLGGITAGVAVEHRHGSFPTSTRSDEFTRDSESDVDDETGSTQ